MNSAKSTMRQPLYRYNPKTCRYERSRISWVSVIFYSLGVFICSALMLIGLLLVHDYVVDSEKEQLLKKENAAIRSTDVVLTRQLDEIEVTLKELKARDLALHNKFFASAAYPEGEKAVNNRSRILLSDGPQLRVLADELQNRASDLMNESSMSNIYYAGSIKLNFYKNLFPSIPSIPPVSEITTQNLVSGFGMRINPFHKGLYHHDGVDITAPRGTEVVATANGRVVTAKFTALQAGYGTYVEIDHGNGFVTRYTHLDDVLIREGSEVVRGQVIALTGNSGGTIAPHLHYEILRDGRNVDPVSYMILGITPEKHNSLKQSSQIPNQSLD